MEPKIKILLAYLLCPPVGIIIAYVTNKDPKSDVVTFHLRQVVGNMILMIACVLLVFILSPILGRMNSVLAFAPTLLYILYFVNFVMGLIAGVKEEKKPMPILGNKFDQWLSFID